jgi:RNA polymerase sigma factor (sigma-70 family)
MGPVIVPVLTVLAGVAVRAIAYAELLARLRWQERQQHTLTELARALPPGCQLHTWTVAYRAFIRHVVNDHEQPADEVPEASPLLPGPGEAEAWLQEQHIILVLRALPPRQRQVFALTIDGWTSAEIAELLGLNPAAVRSNLKKARRNANEHHRATREEAP